MASKSSEKRALSRVTDSVLLYPPDGLDSRVLFAVMPAKWPIFPLEKARHDV
jgi:hypothetical protein